MVVNNYSKGKITPNARGLVLSSAKFKVFYGTFVDTPQLGQLRIRYKTAIGVDDEGSIVFIVDNCLDPLAECSKYDGKLVMSNVQVVDVSDKNEFTTFFFPGFIDTHIHASQYPNAGIFGNSTLLSWLSTYTFPLEESLKDLNLAEIVYKKVVSRTLANGTTTAVYYTTIDPSSTKMMAKVCSELGQRSLIGKVCMDINSPDFYKETTQQCLDSCLEVIDYILNYLNDSKILPVVTPRFAPTCSHELMHGLSDISKNFNNLHIQTHLSENTKEIQLVESLFPECNSYTDVYYKNGLLTDKTILAHCIHLKPDEIELIKKQKSGISHCPISNSSLTSGECQVRMLLDKGVNIGLGTDVSGGFSSSILVTARQAHLVSRHVAMKCSDIKKKEHSKLSVMDALYLGTQGGAQVLKMSDMIGSFAVGKKFDTQLIDLDTHGSNVDVFPWQIPTHSKFSMEDLVCKWFFNGDDRNTIKVWVDGIQISTK